MKTHLLIDVNNLGWRAFYSTGGLSYENIPTGVVFGVIGTLFQLESLFNSSAFVFAFDSRFSNRKMVSPSYKEGRGVDRTPEQQEKVWELFEQIKLLKTDYLPKIGFKNLFQQKGFEADDILASVAQNLPGTDRGIIVSTDQDLYQLLSSRISVYNPRTKFLWTPERLQEQHGVINPKDWIKVKAIAGCSSDNVKGIKGIGEKTAIRYINMTLSQTSKKFRDILSLEGQRIIKQNIPLVKLPYPGTKKFKLQQDGDLEWRGVLNSLNIKSFDSELVYRERIK